MAFHNNIISFGESKLPGNTFVLREEHRDTVAACRQPVLKTLPKLVQEMFEKLDDALYKLADKADSNRQQNAYFDAMREVRKDRKRIERGFSNNILEGYDRFWQGGSATTPSGNEPDDPDPDDLTLVGNEALEDGLAINSMISRGENRYFRALYALNQRFGQMAGGAELAAEANPVAPAAIAEGFHDVIKDMVLDVKVKLVIYKQFEHSVIDALSGLYDEINGILTQAGILPKLTRKLIRRSGYQHARGRGGAGSEGEGPFADDLRGYDQEDAEFQTELFSTLQQLLGHRRGVQSPGMEGHARLPVLESGDVVNVLSSLQNSNMTGMANMAMMGPGAMDIRTSLMQAMQIGQGQQADKKISDNDEDAIDVISMLFEFVLEDKNLPDAMKALLARLQIPMLKVAILDRTLFRKKGHPARRLLNSMAQAAIGWSEGMGRGEGGLFAEMESIVSRILSEFDDDVELFSALNAEFKAFLENENKGTRVTEQRVAQVIQGKEQLTEARHLVLEEINSRLFERGGVPSVAANLLKDGWKDVLLLIYLRKGGDCPEWQEALELMDRLLWSVEPKCEKEQRRELLNEIPVLLKGLRSGLNSITYDQHKMARMFKELQLCHVDCLKGKPVQASTVVAQPPAALESEGIDVSSQTADNEEIEEIVIHSPGEKEVPEPMERDEYQELAENLAIGAWLEVSEDEGEPYRAKLSWRSKVSGACLFVNRKGMKVAELSLPALATWFRGGKASVLTELDVPLMDRAMVAMMKALKNTGGSISAKI